MNTNTPNSPLASQTSTSAQSASVTTELKTPVSTSNPPAYAPKTPLPSAAVTKEPAAPVLPQKQPVPGPQTPPASASVTKEPNTPVIAQKPPVSAPQITPPGSAVTKTPAPAIKPEQPTILPTAQAQSGSSVTKTPAQPANPTMVAPATPVKIGQGFPKVDAAAVAEHIEKKSAPTPLPKLIPVAPFIATKTTTPAPATKAPEKASAGSDETEEPELSAEEMRARIKARHLAKEKEEKEKALRKLGWSPRRRLHKGEFIEKLAQLEFDKLSEAQGRRVYEILQEQIEKASLKRTHPVKVLFTEREYENIDKAASELRVDKPRLIRKLCFSGEKTVETLKTFELIRYHLAKIGGNINQLLLYLNSKKPAFTEEKHKEFDLELKALKEQLNELNRRLPR
jgi:hypothetical protein